MSTPILDTTATCRHFVQHGAAPLTMNHIRLQVGEVVTKNVEIIMQGVPCAFMQAGKKYRLVVEEIAEETAGGN